MVKYNDPGYISSQDKISAITWAADRKNMTYGQLNETLSASEKYKIYEEYMKYKQERRKKLQQNTI